MDKKESSSLTKSELGDIKTHLIQVQGYYRNSLKVWEQLMSRLRTISNGNVKCSTAVERIEILRELEQNVNQLLDRIEGLE